MSTVGVGRKHVRGSLRGCLLLEVARMRKDDLSSVEHTMYGSPS